MGTLVRDCDKGTYYNPLLDGCVECPLQAEGCESIADEQSKDYCLKACKAVFVTEPAREICPSVAERGFQIASGSMLEIALGVLLVIAIFTIIVLVLWYRKKKVSSKRRKDNESVFIVEGPEAQCKDDIRVNTVNEVIQVNTNGVARHHETNILKEMGDSFFTPLQET